MELQSQSLERDDVNSSDEDEEWSEDNRVNTKLPSMRITKMKLVKLNSDESDSDNGDKSDSHTDDESDSDTDDKSDSHRGENAPTSGKEYIKNLVKSWKRKHDIKEKKLDKNFRDTIHHLPGYFDVMIVSRYRTEISEISRVVNRFVAPEDSTDIPASKTEDIIIFLWRELREVSNPVLKYLEIFVLTSGKGYHLIHEDDRDDKFPKQIARRVLEFNLKTLSSKQLTGPHTSEARTYRMNEGTHLSFWDYLGHITTSYNMPLRTNASLFRIPRFEKKYGRPGSVSVTVGEDYLKINMKMSMKDIVAVILQFSRISRGMETFKYRKHVTETDDANFDVFEHVTVVKRKRILQEMNKILCKNLQNCLDKPGRVDKLLMHKNLEKWYSADKFYLQWKADGSRKYKTIKDWHGSPPCIEEIFERVRLETHHTDVKTLYLEFHDNSSDKPSKIRAPLLDLVEGHFRSKSGMSLFRYCGQWLRINNEYITHLGKEFTEIMKRCCLPSSFLPLSWPYSGIDAPKDIKCKQEATERRSVPTTQKKFKLWYKEIFHEDCEISNNNDIQAQSVPFDEYEEDDKAFRLFMRMHCHQAEQHYNEGYILYNDILVDRSSGYLLGDRILVKNVELYDILYYTPKKTYLIHVKEGFGNTTRDACSQIRISADLVFRHIICNNNFDILDEFWEKVTRLGKKMKRSRYRSTVKYCYCEFGKEEFKELFKRREIIYVLASRDMKKAQGPFILYPVEKLRRTFSSDSEDVIDELLRCRFLQRRESGNITITDKVITTTLKDAEDVIELRTKALARKALKILKQSSNESFIAKMEVVHLFSYFRQFQTPNSQLSFKLHSISKSLSGSSQ